MHKALFDQLVQVVATLRGENGCPWDKAQTHETLKGDLIEETYEVIEAIDAKSSDKLQEELGDLLMNVMLHAQIAKDQGDFSINEVVRSITDKLIRRHPHVFGDVDANDTETVLQNWEAIKRSEPGYEDRKSVLDGVPESLPSLLRAQKIQNRAARVGFDWDTVADVLPKLEEEIEEVKASVEKGDTGEIEMEIGDLLFSVVNLCRFWTYRQRRRCAKRFASLRLAFKKWRRHLKDAVNLSKTTIWLD